MPNPPTAMRPHAAQRLARSWLRSTAIRPIRPPATFRALVTALAWAVATGSQAAPPAEWRGELVFEQATQKLPGTTPFTLKGTTGDGGTEATTNTAIPISATLQDIKGSGTMPDRAVLAAGRCRVESVGDLNIEVQGHQTPAPAGKIGTVLKFEITRSGSVMVTTRCAGSRDAGPDPQPQRPRRWRVALPFADGAEDKDPDPRNP